MLDAYTVRKAVPRILIAVIGINLSIYFCLAALDVSTIVGRGIDGLLMSTFKDAKAFAVVSPDTTTEGVLTTLLTGGALWALGGAIIGGLLGFIALVGLLALAIMFTLILTQALIIFLIIVSPVAIACFILPGTEKYFQKWLDLFIKTLMVYPIVYSILAMSKVMAALLIGTSSLSPDSIGGVKVFAAILVIYAPLVLIPFAFKLAGGAIGAIGGMAVGRAQQTSSGIRKGMKENPDSLSNRLRRKVDSKYVDKGLTGGQMWAGATGGLTKGRYSSRGQARAARRGAAKEFDQFNAKQAEAQAGRFKMNSQDSDVQDAMLMTKDQSSTFLKTSAEKVTAGAMSQNQYLRLQRAHSLADAMGRTSANRQAAFLSSDRIKFSGKTHDQEIALANDIFDNDTAAVASAMNAHQAIATGVGRADLAQSLYADKGDLTRGSSKAGASGIMAGHSTGVKNSLTDLTKVLYDETGEYGIEQKVQAAQTLASMQSLSKSPFGQGNEENKRLVQQNSRAIENALNKFADDPMVATSYVASGPNKTARASYLHDDTAKANPELKNAREVQQYDEATGNLVKKYVHKETGEEVKPEVIVTGPEAARERLRQMSGSGIDPAVAASQQQQGQEKQKTQDE